MRVAIFRAGGHFHFGAETRRRAHHRCSYVARQLYWYVASTSCDRAINSAPGAAARRPASSRLCEQFNTRAAPAVHSTSAYSAARCATALRESWRAAVGQASHTARRRGAVAQAAASATPRHAPRAAGYPTPPPRPPPPCPKSLPRGAGVRSYAHAPTPPHNAGLGRRPLREAQARDHKRGRRQVLLPSRMGRAAATPYREGHPRHY